MALTSSTFVLSPLSSAHVEPSLTSSKGASAGHTSISWSSGPFLQGLLMEQVTPSFGASVHESAFNPYSMYCLADGQGGLLWHVNALTQEAADNLILPLLKSSNVEVNRLKQTFSIQLKQLKVITESELTGIIQQVAASQGGSTSRIVMKVTFLTPTAFKSQGEYVILPSIRLLLQNISMRYAMFSNGTKEIDEETLDYLVGHTRLVQYRIRTAPFANVTNTGKNLTGFLGDATLAFTGPSMACGLFCMLLRFGEYSGVGIKTSMGMGGFACAYSASRKMEG